MNKEDRTNAEEIALTYARVKKIDAEIAAMREEMAQAKGRRAGLLRSMDAMVAQGINQRAFVLDDGE